MDVLTPEQRRLNMSRIRGKDTKPELLVRRSLHALGFRFRVNRRDLPGRPDLVFAKARAVVFVHGCFWHGHHCPMCRLPATRPDFWQAKIAGNRQRDEKVLDALTASGWRSLVLWECALRGPARRSSESVLASCAAFIRSSEAHAEILGAWQALGAGSSGQSHQC